MSRSAKLDQWRTPSRRGEKTAEVIQLEVARNGEQLVRVIFRDRRQSERLDLEAIEMAGRSAIHHADAVPLT